jgi:hypothetical protein
VASSGLDAWGKDNEIYSPEQVEAVLEFCEIQIVGDTTTHLLGYCPFHGNSDTPAFEVDKEKGLFYCFNPSCMESGTLIDLVRRRTGQNPFQAQRTINKYENTTHTPFADRLAQAMEREPEFTEYPQEKLDGLRSQFKGSPGEEYMYGRGFSDDTLDHFEIGYSSYRNMVTVPMHDPAGMPVGLIGRVASNDDKRFKNSLNLPKSKTAWNMHRAKTHGDTVIVCEASFDAMRIHQAGYPNVVALLGGHVTSHHAALLGKHFSTIINMTDFEHELKYAPNCKRCHQFNICQGHRPGRDLGRSIVKAMPNKKHLWAAYDDSCVYPHNAKDAGDMTDDEIRHVLRNAISNLEYELWNVEDLVA